MEEQSVGPPGRSDSMASPEGKKVREKRRWGGEIKRAEALKNTSIFTAYVVSSEALFWLLLNKLKTFHKEKGNGFFSALKGHCLSNGRCQENVSKCPIEWLPFPVFSFVPPLFLPLFFPLAAANLWEN